MKNNKSASIPKLLIFLSMILCFTFVFAGCSVDTASMGTNASAANGSAVHYEDSEEDYEIDDFY